LLIHELSSLPVPASAELPSRPQVHSVCRTYSATESWLIPPADTCLRPILFLHCLLLITALHSAIIPGPLRRPSGTFPINAQTQEVRREKGLILLARRERPRTSRSMGHEVILCYIYLTIRRQDTRPNVPDAQANLIDMECT
jgi:hypothetical protein